MTPTETKKVVGLLLAAFPNARMTEATVDLYERMLVDLDFGQAQDAVGRLICTSRFMPTIAEIREASADLSIGPARTGVAAWADVMLAIRRVGQYDLPTFEDPIVAECVRAMGWRYLCTADVPESVDRARFAELYNDLQRRTRVQTITAPGRLLPPPKAEQTAELPGNVRELTRKVGR